MANTASATGHKRGRAANTTSAAAQAIHSRAGIRDNSA